MKSEQDIESQFKDENYEDDKESFMMKCEDFPLQVDDDLLSEKSEHTFSRDN